MHIQLTHPRYFIVSSFNAVDKLHHFHYNLMAKTLIESNQQTINSVVTEDEDYLIRVAFFTTCCLVVVLFFLLEVNY
jgi:hypothetical protein